MEWQIYKYPIEGLLALAHTQEQAVTIALDYQDLSQS
jgi:hypothetical protein